VTTQQEPILAMTASQWRAWFVASFNNLMEPHVKELQETLDELCAGIRHSFEVHEADIQAIGETLSGGEKDADGINILRPLPGRQHEQKIFELLEIVQLLAVDNAFVSGRIDQMTRDFKVITHKQASRTIERTIATKTEEQSSRVSQTTLSILDEVLHGQ
jgi:hypothetical protein